jgi:hypothetical protein
MADENKKEAAIRRIGEALAALATYARVREELILMRTTIPLGVARDKLEQLIRLNQETATEIRKRLMHAEDDLHKESAATISHSS